MGGCNRRALKLIDQCVISTSWVMAFNHTHNANVFEIVILVAN